MADPVTKSSALPAADAGVLVAADELLVRARVGGTRKLARARVDQLPGVATAGDMTKGVYDPDDDGKVTPEEHAATHGAAGSDPLTLAKSQVGLGNVDNTADSDKPVSTATQSALDLKAPLASPVFTGAPAAPTPTGSDDSTKLATTAFVQARLAAILAAAPAALDTLNELAAAINNDPTFAATVTTALGLKLAKASNLADLADAAAARTNLGLGSAALSASSAFAPASHTHIAADLVSGVISTARLGTGTANSSSFLRGDGSWQAVTVPTIASTTLALKGDGAGNASAITNASDACIIQTVGDASATIANNTDVVVLSTTFTAIRTLTLPAASAFTGGRTLRIRTNARTTISNYLKLVRGGTDTLNNSTADTGSTLQTQPTYVDYELISDGVSRWFFIGAWGWDSVNTTYNFFTPGLSLFFGSSVGFNVGLSSSANIALSADSLITFSNDNSSTSFQVATGISKSAQGVVQINGGTLNTGGALDICTVAADPAAPTVAQGARLFVKTVATKNTLYVRFPTGAIQQLAVEP